MKRLYLPLIGVLALVAFVAVASRAQAQTPPLCSSDLYLATGPPTLDVTATPATIDATSGTSLIEARSLNVLGDPPQAGCQVDLSTNLGSFASTGGSTASVQTDAQGVAADSFQCDGVLGTATITASSGDASGSAIVSGLTAVVTSLRDLTSDALIVSLLAGVSDTARDGLAVAVEGVLRGLAEGDVAASQAALADARNIVGGTATGDDVVFFGVLDLVFDYFEGVLNTAA